MAELFLGALLPVLFERLASKEMINSIKRGKVGDLVKKWETKLQSISKLLADAEDKAVRGDDGVLPWLDDLKDLVYDIEDVVDEFVTEEGIRSLSKEVVVAAASGGCGGITRKVRALVPSCCTGLSPRKLWSNHKIRSRMEEIDVRLEGIFEQKRVLGLIEGGGGSMRKMTSDERMTDCLRENYVVGRQVDETAILSKLLTEETVDDHNLSVIPIVGMGGVGKTTLAKSVFNNPRVVEAFPQRGWACVSDNFNMLEIARALLGSLGGDVEGHDINVLHKRLGEILSKQKFLIVLDDYWNENYNDWERLHNIYRLGVKGSRIIVTTRHTTVASMIQAGPMYHDLRVLSPGDCLSLLEYHALGGSSFDAHPHLKTIGKKIANKCQGLPLAAKTLGGLLRSKSDASDWEYILYSEIWNLSQGGKDRILPALRLSYFHLPSHLKRCFVYCAIFPTDYEFDPEELILLWMAEGFVKMDSHENPRMSMRNQGLRQFNELLNRSFFQRSTQNESRFVMHDLMHDLATSVGGITYLNIGLGEFDGVKCKSPEKVRYLSYIPKVYEISARLEKCHVFKGLRTFIGLGNGFGRHDLSNKVVEELLQKMKYLRALSLNSYGIGEVPNCIGHLKHLRYLDLSLSKIKELPESICTLYNLETLILKWCSELIELPRGIEKLVNLRCLDIRGTDALKKMPLGLVRLHKLEILPKFIVGREEEDGLLRSNELKNFQFLQEELSILDLQNVEEVEDARNAQLNAKVGLTTLVLQWNVSSGDSSSRNAEKEKHVLELLRPHQNIIDVEIDGYGGLSFPSWIGSNSFVNMKMLKLFKCQATTTLPSLGLLPSLKELSIQGMDAVCTVGPEFFGNVEIPFPSLEVLTFREMPAWELWSSFGDEEIDHKAFPRLRELKLSRCEKIKSLPQLPTSLQELSLYKFSIESFPEGGLPLSLDFLHIEDCKNLRQPMAEWGLHKLTALKTLSIRVCLCLQGMTCFPPPPSSPIQASDWLMLPSNLEDLRIWYQPNLVRLSNGLRNHLTSLRELWIIRCPELRFLPEEGFPPSLGSLYINGCSGDLKSKCSKSGEYFPLIERIPHVLFL